jgi:CopG family nickel-responsive transcriptional regulator
MLKRFGISLESDLSDQFDEYLKETGYTNRSEAVRDLIRDALIKRLWKGGDAEAAGAVIIVYDHHLYELSKKSPTSSTITLNISCPRCTSTSTITTA